MTEHRGDVSRQVTAGDTWTEALDAVYWMENTSTINPELSLDLNKCRITPFAFKEVTAASITDQRDGASSVKIIVLPYISCHQPPEALRHIFPFSRGQPEKYFDTPQLRML